MFECQALLSRKGALRSVWEAAYFHRKLKKGQVIQTNISSSVGESLFFFSSPFSPFLLSLYLFLLLGILFVCGISVRKVQECGSKRLGMISIFFLAFSKIFSRETIEVFIFIF